MARFQPGVSGNPHGRPRRGASLAERIREKGGADGEVYVSLLHGIATSPKETTRLRIEAVKVLLQRGFGDPPQQVDIEVQPTLSAGEIRQMLDREGLLRPTREAASEESDSERLHEWLNGDWPPL